jgi:predicted adenylyl cyclase CyaB
MPRNVEIKARVPDMAALRERVAAIAHSGPELIVQDDTFFRCTHGRLKLRVFASGHGELIAYERPDATGPKTSNYRITRTADPDGLREALTRSLGQIGRVRKRRTLFLVGATRIHLDEVEGLGDHLEFEVVLRDDQSDADGEAVARDLLVRLQVSTSQLIAGAYLDFILAKSAATNAEAHP